MKHKHNDYAKNHSILHVIFDSMFTNPHPPLRKKTNTTNCKVGNLERHAKSDAQSDEKLKRRIGTDPNLKKYDVFCDESKIHMQETEAEHALHRRQARRKKGRRRMPPILYP